MNPAKFIVASVCFVVLAVLAFGAGLWTTEDRTRVIVEAMPSEAPLAIQEGVTTNAVMNNNCVAWNAKGGAIDSGVACGGGKGDAIIQTSSGTWEKH